MHWLCDIYYILMPYVKVTIEDYCNPVNKQTRTHRECMGVCSALPICLRMLTIWHELKCVCMCTRACPYTDNSVSLACCHLLSEARGVHLEGIIVMAKNVA